MKKTMSASARIVMSLLLASTIGSQKERLQELLVIYYFGSTNIGFCTAPENIEKIKKLRDILPLKHKKIHMKFVLVCLDEDIETGLRFIKKYGRWDEIAVGKAYGNELALNHLNTAELPSLPYIFIFKDTLTPGRWNTPVIKKRRLLVELAGENQIGDWIEEGCPLPLNRISIRRDHRNGGK